MNDITLFDDKELTLILNALVFMGCVDVCVETDAYEDYIDLAIKVSKASKIDPSEDAYISDGIFENPDTVDKLKENMNINVR